ncbi:DUF2460 domain-containing protein [Qipengyuania sp. RANM35]|uniref:DUF2460 domain-containing protein n=1 Tax=Qipengyuania sp. RANM35 TaxID=3068635 RepID=UPI0034DAF9C1
MSFWLARERRGQRSDWIQRFDPRFWTVNFPRPMMASVVSTGPNSLRVDCEFVRSGDLAGLIWESEDKLDHVLLAYATERDYSRSTLSFRWRSSGVAALDQTNGPTLTIEGRDTTGQPRAWYVRLWNFASGTPEDARIDLPFSALGTGWDASIDTVHPSDIDRMFISLVPQGYVEGGEQPFAASRTGWVELTDIACDGERSMLEIGDVILPVHGEQVATAYDDMFNQTPSRILRSIEGLGYRGRIVHYVGMSHYYRLEQVDGRSVAREVGELCAPAIAWHRNYFAEAVSMGFEPIVSLSYELLDANCPVAWRQRAANGDIALTGWEPPSALLSPAAEPVNAFLQSIATQFTALLEEAGGKVLFQVGEPWWWITPGSYRPCLYDDHATTLWGEGARLIDDMRQPMAAADRAFLEFAGSVLAQSTLALTDAVRSAASGEVEVMLLAFTPTIFDPAMPEAVRLNMPTGWAYPAFDRLQLEDYDWLTRGAGALRRMAYEVVADRLGYPGDKQDYLAGFVLDPADCAALWPLIDAGLEEARQRGVAHRFVWALPQVQRDGYTRLPATETDVQAFDDVAYPLALGRDASVSPEFSTTIAVTASGHEARNALWSDARLRYDVGPGIRSEAELGELIAFFRARYGPARGFRLRDPFDHSSNGMTGASGPADQPLGIGNGVDDRFRLAKSYGEQARAITRPVAETVRVSVDGAETAAFNLAPGGWVVLDEAPPVGAEVRGGFLFDVPVRFAEDRLDVSGLSFAAGEAPSVPLIEIREAV